jgi:hypothetical protein
MRVKKYHTKLFGTKFLLNVVYESELFKLVGNLFQATAPLYENDFLEKFVFAWFRGHKIKFGLSSFITMR